MAKSKFKLGPLQKKWIKALRSGKYRQAEGQLCEYDHHRHYKHCCLGVACELIHGKDFFRKQRREFEGGGLSRWESECSVDKNIGQVLGEMERKSIGLRRNDGCPTDDNFNILLSLAEYNDEGYSFKEIADIIEKNPHRYFYKSV